MVDVSSLRQLVDLPALATQAGSTLRRTGAAWLAGPCPLCGGIDRFVAHQTEDGWRWLCRGCGDGKYHDCIDFYCLWRGVTFAQACADLAGSPLAASNIPVAQPQAHSTRPPAELQAAAREVIAQASAALWSDSGKRARAWLNGRGLTDDTLRRWQIGHISGNSTEWRKLAGLSVPCGVLIPCIIDGVVWSLKVRRAAGKPKYLQVRGLAVPALFGADTLSGHDSAVITEGEFDTMLLHQAAGDLCGVMTLGSASDPLNVPTWAGYLLPISHLLVAYDTDAAGDKGAAKLLSLTRRAQRVSVPVLGDGDKDLTDFRQHGGDLRAWLTQAIGTQDDTETLETELLEWSERRGYEPAYGPDGHIVLSRVGDPDNI
jgi:phage/plasmid primase-like uncharacterized protein